MCSYFTLNTQMAIKCINFNYPPFTTVPQLHQKFLGTAPVGLLQHIERRKQHAMQTIIDIMTKAFLQSAKAQKCK